MVGAGIDSNAAMSNRSLAMAMIVAVALSPLVADPRPS
jgi:hypothetical protein